MSSEQSQLQGPDLSRGVPVDQVMEGATLLGHADGEPVVLVRCNGQLHAVGATCSHYSGPLAEGIVVDGTIRCPWHHAAFDLATGGAARFPALNDIPCWKVEEREGLAIVGSRRPAGRPARSRRGSTYPESIVVIGGGAAGAAAVETLRREAYERPITLITAERTAPVDRPNLSKDYLAGTAQEEWIPLRPDSWYAENGVTLLTDTRVTALDGSSKRITLADGRSIEYDAILLATGAAPIRLPLGDDAPIHYLRTWDDSRAIIERAGSARSAVVLGASFIGLEVAASLRTRGLDVTVVAPEQLPLERALGAELGRAVREIHEGHGVAFRLGHTAREVDRVSVVLDDGERVAADLVVAGVGVRPSLELAESAGLVIDGGVVVSELLETSAPGVFAAGDIARWPDPHSGRSIRVEHWVVAQQQGQAAARNMLGAREPFGAVPFFWSAHYDVSIRYVGHAERPDRVAVDGDPGDRDCTVRYLEGERLAAIATIGRDQVSLEAEARMEHVAHGRLVGSAA